MAAVVVVPRSTNIVAAITPVDIPAAVEDATRTVVGIVEITTIIGAEEAAVAGSTIARITTTEEAATTIVVAVAAAAGVDTQISSSSCSRSCLPK